MRSGEPIEIFEVLVASLHKVAPRKARELNIETHLVDDGVLDSLDVMSFLFEFEQRLGYKLAIIDEEFSDFRVRRLVEIAAKAR
jgi:acyl carrier protein